MSANSFVFVGSEQNGSVASQDGGYNYLQHFDILSPYTLALKYGNAGSKLPKPHQSGVWMCPTGL